MPIITANGIDIDYAENGQGPALILIRGLGTQRIQWPQTLVEGLGSHGLRVIMPDNRDVGLSQKFDADGTPTFAEAIASIGRGEVPAIPYTLKDMAQDIVGLMDSLAIERAHIVGISMGGMIVQNLAALHGDRLLSMTSIMSSSGAPGLPEATPEAREVLMSSPESSDREAVVAHTIRNQAVLGSPGYPTPEATLREMAGRCFDRCYCPAGVGRQMLAVLSDVGRFEALGSIETPTLVIHGEDDPLVPIEGGRDTAERIPGADFYSIPGMGHDVAPGLVPRFIELIADHVKRAESD